MNNGKQVDIKERLDGLDSLPGETAFNKDAAWEKLHHRLQEKPRHNRIVWYWAAACLLPAVLVLWMVSNKSETFLVKTIQQKKHTNIPVIQLPLVQKEMSTVSPSITVEKNQSIKNIHKKAKNIPVDKTSNTQTAPFLVTTVETMPEGVTTIIPPANTITAIATITMVKKKLRVVHINELDNIPEQIASSVNHEQKSFRFRLGDIRSSNMAPADRPEYATGLKITFTN